MIEFADVNPIDNSDLYDTIVLGGVRSPGKVVLSGHDSKVNWDVKAGQGQSGASVTLKDIPLVEFTATFTLTDAEDFAAWPNFLALINSTLTTKKGTSASSDPKVLAARAELLAVERSITKTPPTTSFEIATMQARLEAARSAVAQATGSAVTVPASKSALEVYHPDLVENGITSVVKALVAGTVHDGKGGQTRVVKFQAYRPPQPVSGSVFGASTSSKKADPNQGAKDELERLTKAYESTPWG